MILVDLWSLLIPVLPLGKIPKTFRLVRRGSRCTYFSACKRLAFACTGLTCPRRRICLQDSGILNNVTISEYNTFEALFIKEKSLQMFLYFRQFYFGQTPNLTKELAQVPILIYYKL